MLGRKKKNKAGGLRVVKILGVCCCPDWKASPLLSEWANKSGLMFLRLPRVRDLDSRLLVGGTKSWSISVSSVTSISSSSSRVTRVCVPTFTYERWTGTTSVCMISIWNFTLQHARTFLVLIKLLVGPWDLKLTWWNVEKGLLNIRKCQLWHLLIVCPFLMTLHPSH